jgi:signal transduction histidine kinase
MLEGRRPQQRREINWQLFWDVGVTPVVVLLIVGATLSWVAYGQYQQVQEAEYRLLEAHARNAEVQVVGAVSKLNQLLQRVANQRQQTGSPAGKAFSAWLKRNRKEFPELGSLWVTDANGRIQAATDASLVGREVSGETYFGAHRDPGQPSRLFMSRPEQALLGVTAVVFSIPMTGIDGEFLGIAGIAIDFRFFPTVLQGINPDDSASMTVIYNRDGDIVFRRQDPEQYFGFNIVSTSTVYQAHLDAGGPATRHIGPSAVNGKTRLFLVRDAGDTGLSLVLSRQLDEVLAPWQHSVTIHTLIFAFTLAVVGYLAIVGARRKRDVLTAKQWSEDANRAKSRFLAAVSHDLRQPIFAQGLFLSTLARTELTPYQREILDNADAVAKSSVAMLNTLLDFSRIEAGVVTPRLQAFRLQPLLNKIEREFSVQADAKGITYRSRETPLLVRSDPVLVESILRNLVSNAIRYTERGGLLVACRKRNGQALLEVWDTGIGIAPENQMLIFREFLQLANSEQDRQKGLGLGLAIVDGLARTLGHELSLVSRLRRGSVFRLSLPLAVSE